MNALTIDVEDYFQVSAFEKQIPRHRWGAFESRVVANTHRILRLLNFRGVRATFFILGWVARRYPELVRDIRRDGHEVGSHSYWHRLIYQLSPAEFRKDLQLSRDVLQDILGEAVTAYRAPSFSITKRSLWALEVLAEEGFQSDSSIFPIHHDRYGIPDVTPRIHKIRTAAGVLCEFPPSVVRIAGQNFPVSGGGYFRLYPLCWTRRWLQQINERAQPFLFYVHPWELDPEQPRLAAGSWLSRFRHYVNLSSTEVKLDFLLRHFSFAPLQDVIQSAVAAA
jgi:polysaccharide deacetylase family protein (PEP-CTERM system associated)